MNKATLALVFAVVAGGAVAEPYRDLGKVDRLECVSASGRTEVQVEKVSGYFEVTAVQDGRRVLLDRVRTAMLIQETFPARYLYKGRTTGKTYLTLGQTTRDFQTFSKVGGSVRYQKEGVEFNTPVTCEVQD